MSYILNALRKSERERQRKLETELGARLNEEKPGKHSNLARWLIALVALNAALLAFVVFRGAGDEPNATTLAKSEPERKTASRRQSMPPPLKAAPQASPKPKEEATSIAKLIEEKKRREQSEKLLAQSAATPADRKIPKALTITDETAVKKESLATLQAEEVKPAITNAITAAPLAVEKTPEPSAPRNEKAGDGILYLDEMPAEFRRDVPELDINVHVYSERPEERFIMVSMKKYLSGQEIAAGMVLQEIEADAILVEYRGKRFRISRN